MKYYSGILLSALILTFISSCSSKEEQYCAFNNVEYVNNPTGYKLEAESEFSLPYIGILDFKIQDSLMILTNSGKNKLVTIIDKDTHNLYGEFINYGRGPGECRDVIFHSNLTFINENQHLIGYFENFGSVYRFDLTESLLNKETIISRVSFLETPNLLMRVLPLNKNRFFIKEVSSGFDSQRRYIYTDGNRSTNTSIDSLNLVSLRKNNSKSLFNILSTFVHYNPDKDVLVEVPIFLRNINLYSLNKSYSKTICIGDGLQDINNFKKLENAIRWAKDFRGYSDFFAILDKASELDISLLLFKYDGTFIDKYILDHNCSSFDIDFSNNTLYTYDVDTEHFRLYDFTEVLNRVNKTTTIP